MVWGRLLSSDKPKAPRQNSNSDRSGPQHFRIYSRSTSRSRPNKPKPADAPTQPVTAPRPHAEDVIEDQVLSAVRQIQSAAGAEADRMRAAIREAIKILQAALES